MQTHDAHWDLTELWDGYRPTPLLPLPALARRAGVAQVLLKWEGERPLGNFKALGGLYAGLRALARAVGAGSLTELQRNPAAARQRLLCASDGNHGLAVAAAAARVGAACTVYLPEHVDAERARRIVRLGARVERVRGTYDDAVDAAAYAAQRGEGLLIADTGPDPNDPVVADVMAGYGLLAHELRAQLREQGDGLSQVYVQAGVGGLAAAMADGLRDLLVGPGRIVVIEPAAAACVGHAMRNGRPERIDGDLATAADMLSCGLASAPALQRLLAHGAVAETVDETELAAAPTILRDCGGPATTASGAAGIAGLLRAAADPALRSAHGLAGTSRVLVLATERPPD
ncbi:pyridoxal-phosphate dependent enzyme [Lysobacter silvisoli]|uniref:Pyridoxal-phosphate dependent enzyme n=1 Tax=Lysobacter silvisoli TaxID=2293254 RepID=A0A371K2T4_9GAMM|nr:pyridoxal-phosphate dependent enzyme [Lysobacter silvisoli]RDZ28184.1 pyridoxal-phosphate dependent enzyme [Lysobacter silvisoli]